MSTTPLQGPQPDDQKNGPIGWTCQSLVPGGAKVTYTFDLGRGQIDASANVQSSVKTYGTAGAYAYGITDPDVLAAAEVRDEAAEADK
jgi:hypothetical protein